MRRVKWFVWAAAIMLLAGCGGPDDVPESPLDEGQAERRVDTHIDDTVTVLPDSLELELVGPAVKASCDHETFLSVSKKYWLRDIPPGENEQHVEALVEYWKDHGYTVHSDQRPDNLFVSVEHKKDKFSMSVRSSIQKELSIGASSPCIHPDGADR
ncbi:hypothetical protein CLV63_12252 [Murinocardiopsis flavida]|uniref:Lipoprotein n=1 Tax=Murinocardiopsis flavida TaxID=645275 RepID=A0A2P8CZV4_9ACTN|nr:hypothetical protein [Murinocardiopsis flavida]PSK90518.1 hypothetical protein CLV63_12252 [Murinocardiopsis flavida]